MSDTSESSNKSGSFHVVDEPSDDQNFYGRFTILVNNADNSNPNIQVFDEDECQVVRVELMTDNLPVTSTQIKGTLSNYLFCSDEEMHEKSFNLRNAFKIVSITG